MKTTVVRPDDKYAETLLSSPPGARVHAGTEDRWAARSATAGAAVWAGIAVLARFGIARMGAIELLFLFAPLVIVPLGMELGRTIAGNSRFEDMARRFQPLGGALALLAMWLAPGRAAGLVALAWLAVCCLMGAGGVTMLIRALSTKSVSGGRSELAHRVTQAAVAVARMDLVIGGAWLVASRLGLRPMGIQEPIGLLTAVHFHYAGFATATIGAAMLDFMDRRTMPQWLPGLVRPSLVLVVVVLPFAVAAGFVISPVLKMAAAMLFAVSVATLAVYLRACGQRAENPTARGLLQVASASVLAGVVLAGMYAFADFVHSDALPIPQMARTHGLLNAIGFCLPALLGWLVEYGTVRRLGSDELADFQAELDPLHYSGIPKATDLQSKVDVHT